MEPCRLSCSRGSRPWSPPCRRATPGCASSRRRTWSDRPCSTRWRGETVSQSRREFLLRTGCGALGLAASQAAIEKLGLISAIAKPLGPSDYRALVCVFLDGGNDGSNMVIPADAAGYAAYAAARSGSALTIPQTSLLPITP